MDQKPHMRMQQSLNQGWSRDPSMQQQQRMSPPIAYSVEEAQATSERQSPSALDETGLALVKDYLGTAPQATDRDLIGYLHDRGYSPTIRDISLVRSILETE